MKTKQSHTNGPWVAKGNEVWNEELSICVAYSHGRNGPWESVIEEHKANARLIAAAPELLVAAKMFTENIAILKDNDGYVPAGYDELLDAIAKAQGQEEK